MSRKPASRHAIPSTIKPLPAPVAAGDDAVREGRELNEGRPRAQGNDAEDGRHGDGNGANHQQDTTKTRRR
jgi:hypothetical protein